MDLWLIRHPRPLVAPGVCYGRLDLPVAAAELQAAADRLAGRLPAHARWRTSPARRCLDLARRLHAAALPDARLVERGFGDWEGRAWDDIGAAALDAWAADPWNFAPPGGESARALVARVAAALDEDTTFGHPAVWITHQGVARAAARQLLGLADAEWMTLALDFGAGLHLARVDGIWRRIRE